VILNSDDEDNNNVSNNTRRKKPLNPNVSHNPLDHPENP